MYSIKIHCYRRSYLLSNASRLVLVLSLVLLIRFTKALQQFAVIDDNKRTLQAQTLPPPNDNCTGAIIIPSDFVGSTYTTPGVPILHATSSNVPYQDCYASVNDVWYQFTPSTRGFFMFGANLGAVHMTFFKNKVNLSCENAEYVTCRLASTSYNKTVQLDTNQTYLIQVQPTSADETRRLQLTVERKKAQNNSQCTNASIVDPTVETFLTIYDNSPFAIHDKAAVFPYGSRCYAATKPTFWYKVTNPLTMSLLIDVTLDARPLYGSITILKGVNCSVLQCVGSLTKYYDSAFNYDFLADARTSYYIVLRPNSPKPFNMTIVSRTQYFSVIDSKTDKVIQLLRDKIDYYQIRPSSVYLSIKARFSISPELTKSVRLTYDNPKRNICDNRAPYSVFGDLKGDYNNVTIPLGRHTVTATPYTLPNCTGRTGKTIEQNFTVSGCLTEFLIDHDCTGNYVTLRPFTSEQFSSESLYKHTKLPVVLSLKDNVYMTIRVNCGFPVQLIRTEIRNATTGKVVTTKTFTPPGLITPGIFTYLEPIITYGYVAEGSYTMRAIINNVVHPSINFTVTHAGCS